MMREICSLDALIPSMAATISVRARLVPSKRAFASETTFATLVEFSVLRCAIAGRGRDLFGRLAQVLHNDSLRLRGFPDISGNPAGRHDVQNHKQRVEENRLKRSFVIEDAGGKPDPKNHVMQSDGDAGGQQRRDPAINREQRDQNEDLEMRLNQAVEDVNTERGDAHRGDRYGDHAEL